MKTLSLFMIFINLCLFSQNIDSIKAVNHLETKLYLSYSKNKTLQNIIKGQEREIQDLKNALKEKSFEIDRLKGAILITDVMTATLHDSIKTLSKAKKTDDNKILQMFKDMNTKIEALSKNHNDTTKLN